MSTSTAAAAAATTPPPSIIIKRQANDKSVKQLNPTSPTFLQDLVSPMSVEEFRTTILEARENVAYASVGGANSRRVKTLLDEYLHGGDVGELVENTSSPNGEVSVWLNPVPTKSDATAALPLTSIKMNDAQAIMKLYELAGWSLYFRAPTEANEALTKSLTRQLGRLFCEDGATGDGIAMSKSEVEVFVANRNDALTARHTDFQDNFTVQLRGKKTWLVSNRRSVRSPLRGVTPHFANVPLSTLERQILGVRACGAESTAEDVGKYHIPPPYEEFETVTLGPGDFLYHPSGIWHQVCTEEAPSLSINISLVNPRWCDVISDNLRQYLFRFPFFRSPVDKRSFLRLTGDARGGGVESNSNWEEISRITNALPFRVEDLIPRYLLVDDGAQRGGDAENEEGDENLRVFDLTEERRDGAPPSSSSLGSYESISRNPLACVVFDDDLDEEPAEDPNVAGSPPDPPLSFIVSTNFGDSNGDLISATRCELHFPARFRALIKRLAVVDRSIAASPSGDEIAREIERLCREISPKIQNHRRLLEALVRSGLLTVKFAKPRRDDDDDERVVKRRRG